MSNTLFSGKTSKLLQKATKSIFGIRRQIYFREIQTLTDFKDGANSHLVRYYDKLFNFWIKKATELHQKRQ